MKRLYRSRKDRVLAGICGGLGEYFDIDPVIVRLITVGLTLFGLPLLIYLLAIFIIPNAPLESGEPGTPEEKKKARLSPEEKNREKARMEEHVRILGILYIALSALGILAAIIVFVVLVGSGIITGDDEVIFITRIVGISVSGLLLLLSLPGIFAGLGLLKYESWARILAMVLGILNLVNIPFGTILGIYTIWVLTNKEVQELFR
ncbi:MAG: PspC domain-containing protein [Candidatus Aminicenantes bacterium]|nr:MAG: PspC domain-containing protein [Candidatus Aminicenantes bacterium]